MTGRKIQRKRFKRLDSLGFSEISRIYIEECQNVRELRDKIFDRLPDGRRVGCSLFYDWVDARGHRKDWGETIAFRRQLLMESIREIELNPKDEDFDWRMFQMQTRMTQSAVPWSFFSASGFLGRPPRGLDIVYDAQNRGSWLNNRIFLFHLSPRSFDIGHADLPAGSTTKGPRDSTPPPPSG